MDINSEIYQGALSGLSGEDYGESIKRRQGAYQQAEMARMLQNQARDLFAPVEAQVQDPLAKALVHMTGGMAQSGNALLTEKLPELIHQMQGKLYQTVDPTDLQKNFNAAGINIGDPKNRDLMLQAILKPQTQINMGRPTPPAGYHYSNPDSESLDYIPGGPADPNTKPMTDFEGKALSFFDTASSANNIFNELEPTITGNKLDIKHEVERLPLVGNLAGMAVNSSMSPEQQQADNAQRAFVNAIVRSQTGADAKDSEIDNLRKIYFPDSSASPAVKAQMRGLREVVLNSLHRQSGADLRRPPKKTYRDYKKPGQKPEPEQNTAPPAKAAAPVITESKQLPNGMKVYKVDGRWMTED